MLFRAGPPLRRAYAEAAEVGIFLVQGRWNSGSSRWREPRRVQALSQSGEGEIPGAELTPHTVKCQQRPGVAAVRANPADGRSSLALRIYCVEAEP